MACESPALSTLDDVELARRVRNSDQEAFRILFQKHSRWVYAKIYRILGNHEDSEEVLHDVFLKVWEKIDRWDPDAGSFQAWLNEVAKNTIIDAIRRRLRRVPIVAPSEEEGELLWVLYEDPQPLPDVQVEHREILDLIQEALQQVHRPHHRIAWALRHLEGMSIAEITEAMQSKEGTIKIWIYRCNRELAQILRRKGIYGSA